MFFSIEYPKLFSNDSNNDDSLNYLKSLTFNHICSSDDFLTMTSVFSQYHSTTIHKDSLCNTNVIVQKFSNNFATVVHTKNNKNKNIFLPFIPINSVKLFMNYSSKFPLDLEFMNQLNLAFIHFLLKQFRTGKQFRHMFIATKINDNSSIDILLESGYIFRLLVKFQKAELIYYDQLKQSMIENESISLSEANEQFQLISFNDYTLNHLKLIIQTTINKLSSYDQIVFTKSVRLMKRFIAIHLCYNDANEFVQVKNDYSKLFTSITVELIALHIYNGSKKIRSIFDFFFHFLQFLSKIKTNSIITLTGEEKSHSKQKLNYLMFEIDEVNEEKVLNISRLISPHSSIVQRMKLICENSVRYLNNSMNETMNIKKIFQTSTTTFKNRLTINSEFNSRFYQCLNDQQLKNIHLKFPQFHFNPIQKFFPVFQFDVIDEFIKVIRESFPSDTYYVGRDQFGGMDIFIEQIKKKDGDDFHKRFNNIQNLGKSILIFK
ncbi:hypothetical protein SNEBB_006930 [Seison nebaliae]|nr:hypothetical protein SNEBB_006930 [Seison nebaliae]